MKYKAGSLMTLATVIKKFKLYSYLMAVQEVIWNKGGIVPAGDYTFFCGSENENYE
jgi:hypothetical protein